MNRKSGFTIYELLITIAVIATTSPFIYSAIRDLMQKRTAMEYADYSKIYANRFIENIESNYGEYYIYAQNNPTKTQFIPFSKIKNTIHSSMNWGVIPCVAMRYESANKEIQAVMFYTNNTTVNYKKINKSLGAKAMNEFGSGSGYNESGIVNGINGTWALAKNNHFMEQSLLSACDTNILTENSLVINLNMLANFPRATPKSSSTGGQYLSRTRDDSSQFGELGNANTMQTDIVMHTSNKYSGIFISGDESTASNKEQIYLGTINSNNFNKVYQNKYNDNNFKYDKASSLMVLGGGVQAENFLTTRRASIDDKCNQEEAGMIVKVDKVDSSVKSNGTAQSLVCNGTNFVPLQKSIRFNFPNGVTSWSGCPAGTYIEPGSVSTTSRADENVQYFQDTECLFKDGSFKPSYSGYPIACIYLPVVPTLKYRPVSSTSPEEGFYHYLYSSVSIDDIASSSADYIKLVPAPNRDSSIVSCDCDNKRFSGNPAQLKFMGKIIGVTCSTISSSIDNRTTQI